MTALEYTSGTAIRLRMNGGTADQSVLDGIGTAVNEWMENYIGAPVGPAGTAIRTFDGDGSNCLWIRQGVNTITTLEVADQTGGSYTAIGTAYYRLRPHDYDRPTGWPAFRVELTEQAPVTFTQGWDTVRVTPGTVWGWTAIPPELSDIAVRLGVKKFQSRKSGEADTVGDADVGIIAIGMLRKMDWDTLDRYRYVISPAYTG